MYELKSAKSQLGGGGIYEPIFDKSQFGGCYIKGMNPSLLSPNFGRGRVGKTYEPKSARYHRGRYVTPLLRDGATKMMI